MSTEAPKTFYEEYADYLDWHGSSDELIMREAFVMGACLTEFFHIVYRFSVLSSHD